MVGFSAHEMTDTVNHVDDLATRMRTAQTEYKNQKKGSKSVNSGFFGRLLYFAEWIRLVDLLDKEKEHNLLFVGPSIDSHDMGGPQCYDIYELFAYFFGNGIKMGEVDALDLNPKAFDRFKTDGMGRKRARVGACLWDYAVHSRIFEKSWQRFIEYVGDRKATPADSGTEYHHATLSKSLVERVEATHTTIGDVALTELPLRGFRYDVVVCRHVLWQLPECGLQSALYGLSKAMNDNGLLLVGHGLGLNAQISQPDIHPRLSEELQESMGLKYLEGYEDTVLRKER